MNYDVAVIGAGPCGLAVAARLCEPTPAALFSDAEHNRYWRKFSQKNTLESEFKSKTGRRSSSGSGSGSGSSSDDGVELPPPSVVVLDTNSTEWMAAWKARFRNLQITHLRSPLFFHPDPRDRDALLGFAHHQQRTDELHEIRNVVGKELSKHSMKKKKGHNDNSKKKGLPMHLRIDGRDRIDYFTPSARLFEDFCEDIVDQYSLKNMVKQAEVRAVHYEQGEGFVLDTTDGSYLAKIVVVAVGAKPRVVQQPIATEMRLVKQKLGGASPRNVVVVGGGLTSAQIADILIRRYNVAKVWLLIRGKYKVKHFDVDLEWVSKTRNQRMAMFWTADTDEERLQMLREARGGGSITPEFDKILKAHVKDGRLSIHPNTLWKNGSTKPEIENLPEMDHVLYATGGTTNLDDLTFLEPLRSQHKIKILGGLPCLSDDMMWNDDVPCFFTGALAGLRLGPGAANLAGARMGAERIAWKVDDLLGRTSDSREQVQRDIIGNRFQAFQAD